MTAAPPPRRRSRRRAALAIVRPLVVAIALVSGLSAGLASAPAEVAAATPDLTLVTNATYVADPSQARIAVGVDIVAADHKPDTRSFRYYFDGAYLAVLPNTSGFSLTASGAKPSVSVAKRTPEYTLLHLVFGTRVYYGDSLRLHLAFEMSDRGGSPTRDVRVGQALVQFPVWAFASDATPGSSVTVSIPAGYTIALSAGQLDGPTSAADGSQVLTSGALADPLSFFAYVTADRPGAYATSAFTTSVEGADARIEVDAWPDDAAWGTKVADLFRRGLPALGSSVGLPYPRTDPLVVRESVSRTLGGYAGIFDPASGRIDVDYAASPFVILHEASHVWFNGSLLADRWANEAFATYYGGLAAHALGVEGGPDVLTPDLLKSRIPLNAWGAVGQEPPATEDFAYAATAQLGALIATRAGADGMRRVWAAADARESAYQPAAGPVERSDSVADWRALLDLLEERTGQRFDDLWSAWVVRPSDAPLLAQRATARIAYAALLQRAGDWRLPAPVRKAMDAWRFDTAEGLISQAGQVLDAAAEVRAAASAAGLTPPATLRSAFEGDAGFPAAKAEADAELRTIAVFRTAVAARPPAGDPIVELGLVGSDPEGESAAARTAFASGDLPTAANDMLAAQAAWLGARDAGTRRALAIGGIVGLVLAMLLLAIVGMRSRARRRRLSQAHPLSGGDGRWSGPVAERSYATLAPEPPPAAAGPAEAGGGEGSERT
ncbi:MAG TPA: hypothetical protein VEY67_09525 [Candidatus Dormibacteraeota bacterium]|nr:hypothetical protein [Candidatus Dormibacteraeota bacterium]